MSIKNQACIAGIYEHPTRHATELTIAQLHADVALGALADAGLSPADVDGYFCAADAPGIGGFSMAEYIGLNNLRYMDTTETGGSSYLLHVSHAARAVMTGQCNVALITMADRPLAAGAGPVLSGIDMSQVPEREFAPPVFMPPVFGYAMVARRHMHEFGTTPEQLAWVKVAASTHAQFNPHAKLRDVVTLEEVLASPLVANPLRRADCCVVTDGGGALVITKPEIAKTLNRPVVKIAGAGEAFKNNAGGRLDPMHSAGLFSSAKAYEEAGVKPEDIKYASLYDSFTITVIMQLEDLGFCKKGEGGRFVEDGNLISGIGKLPVNTDGGGLCSNHPGNKGGMTKMLEAVRQCRGEAHRAVQVPDHSLVLAHGTGGLLSSQHMSGTVILEAE